MKITAQEWDESVTALLALGRSDEALSTLQRAVAEASGPVRFAELLRLLEGFPPPLRESAAGMRLHLRLLGNLPGPIDRITEEVQRLWAAGKDEPFLHVFLGWVLAEAHEDAESLKHTSLVLNDTESLLPFERVLLWRTRGRSLARLGQDGWSEAFVHALTEAQGRSRVMTLQEWAALLVREGENAGAMTALSEALGLAMHDPLEVRVREQLGLLCLSAGEFEDAEQHFRRMERLAEKSEAYGLRSRAICSLAGTRRALGEWKRAEQLYNEALKIAIAQHDEADQRQALRGLGHTRRLSGRPLSALEPLEQAARVVRADRESGESWVYVDIAAALVSVPLLNVRAVQDALDRHGHLGQEDAGRATVVQAELARRTGDSAAAVQWLQSLQLGSLWLREEAHAFPELFALLPPAQRPLPLPLTQQTTVQFKAIGFPVVKVNGREVTLSTLAVVALATLLDNGGQANRDMLVEVLRDGKPRSDRQAEQRVSKAMSTLRRALGWESSVQTRSGYYALDPEAQWQYDVADAQRDGQPIRAFLSGIDLPWVTEQEQHLSLGDSGDLRL